MQNKKKISVSYWKKSEIQRIGQTLNGESHGIQKQWFDNGNKQTEYWMNHGNFNGLELD